ncbi:SulP family inorganic anion transporter [Hyphobacterium sp.]|uniref:SulP family inorganic anion transporter n=1 Tax=Hyphobacterium sp. TaxID=2004662 RepID=UPI003B5239B8
MKPKIITTLQGYTLPDLLRDSAAGVTVAMVALPLSLAIAIASGAPPETGLITAAVGGLLISLLGGSRVQIGGPTGAFIVVVYAVIQNHGLDGLLIATLMAGIILVIAGYLRVGKLVAYVPEAVINGFTIGIALLIATSQLKDFLGIDLAEVPAGFFDTTAALWNARGTVSPVSILLALGAMVFIVVARRLSPRIPGLIVAMILASLLVWALTLDIDTIASRFGDIESRLPMPGLPGISLGRVIELIPSALTIAFLAGVESLLSAIVADRMIGGSHRSGAELAAQGFANIGSALFGGLPATGAIARTATNVQAGGRTPVAGIVHALTILIVMLLAAPLIGYLAMPALAALLMLTAWNMSEPHKWRGYLEGRKSDLFLVILTFALTVAVDLTVAIAVGVVTGLVLRLRRRDIEPEDWTPPKR